MKVFCISIIILLFSCSKEEEEVPVVINKLIEITGKWYHKEVVVDNVTYPYDDHETCGKDYIEFFDTNKIRSIDVFGCQEDVLWTGTYTKTNNNLNINNSLYNLNVEIVELSSTALSYKYKFDKDNNGVPENYIEKYDR